MNNIKSFNQKINLTKNNRYLRWSEYRKALTNFIISEDLDNKEIMIIGAGNLDDINISKLVDNTKKVYLLDIDKEAIIKGLKKQNIDINKVNIIEFDLTQLENMNIIDRFKDSIENNNIDKFISKFESVNLNYNLPKVDIVLILPIYTQILFQQMILEINNNYAGNKRKAINKIMNFTGSFIRKVNKQLGLLLDRNGKIIAVSDILEYTSDSKDLEYLLDNIKQTRVVEKFVNKYIGEYGYTLGIYGLEDISENMEKVNKQFFMWNFDNNRHLLVKAIVLK